MEPQLIIPTSDQRSSERERYSYTSIEDPDTIRILTVNPGLPGDPLSGELHQTSLSSVERTTAGGGSQSYEAILYVSGEGIVSRSIQLPGGFITITPNLEEVLCRFRHRDRPRELWADGICINQNDVHERGRQVKFMGRVYSTASKVLIWLGRKDEGGSICGELRKAAKMDLTGCCSIVSLSHSCLAAVKQMVRCEWFTRLWIVQECLLSIRTSFSWGYGEIDLQVALAAVRYLIKVSVGHLGSAFWFDLIHSSSLSFLDVLQAIRGQNCSDPRDHIYAILGLPYEDSTYSKSFFQSLVPDYTKSARQLFLDVAQFYVRHGKLETLLWQVRLNRTSISQGLP